MAITYRWEVTGLKVKDEGANKNAVVQTYWKKYGTDESGNEGVFVGATPFTSANVPSGQFVPFDQLTEEMVINWIKSVVVGDYEAHVNGKILDQIDQKVNVVTEMSLPWAPSTEDELTEPDPVTGATGATGAA